jgi:hypothetical protein
MLAQAAPEAVVPLLEQPSPPFQVIQDPLLQHLVVILGRAVVQAMLDLLDLLVLLEMQAGLLQL